MTYMDFEGYNNTVKKGDMGRTRSMMGACRNSYNLFVRQLEGNRYYGIPTIRRKDKIKMDVKEV
jgi:hypothetical protein